MKLHWRNLAAVLVYFEHACAQESALKLQSSLICGGWLIVSPSEMSHELFKPLASVQLAGALLRVKDAGERGARLVKQVLAFSRCQKV